jgi:hypothetical protein
MNTAQRQFCFVAFAFSSLALPTAVQGAVTGFGVTATGALFKFDVDVPAVTTPIGNIGFTPEAIDFRPLAAGQTDPVLYGIDVGPVTTQLYTINKATAVATPVGAGFPTVGAGYTLAGGNNPIGFDFNPRTLQADNSIRIRLVASNGTNLRLNSDTGLVAAVDTALAFVAAPGASPFVDAAAYINNSVATLAAGGTTQLFTMDLRTDHLYLQNPPNNGSLNDIGSFGFGVDGNPGAGFDIYSDPISIDDTIGGDRGLAVFTRDATAGGAYLLYEVNLATGATTNGRLVGGGIGFEGGFSVMPGVIPEPGTCTLLLSAIGLGLGIRRRRGGQ